MNDIEAVRAAAEVQPSVNVDSKLLLTLYAERDEARMRADPDLIEWAALVRESKSRAEAAEAALSAERAEVERLRRALAEARDDMQAWQSYAPDYFRDKHDAAGDLAKIDQALTKEPPHAG